MLRIGSRVSSAFPRNGFGILFSHKSTAPTPGGQRCLPLVQHAAAAPPSRAYSSILARTPSLVQTVAACRLPLASNWSPNCSSLLRPSVTPVTPVPVRTVTKFSRQNGKRKSVKAVLKRFMRLDWGAWIRTKSGRNKKLWKKSSPQKRRLRQHVLTNSTQSWLLDSMVTSFWRRPKYYVNDPYSPYHTRDEFVATRRKH